MAASASDYRDQLAALLPRGAAWTREAGSVLGETLRAIAEEFARVDARANILIDETDPRSTTELLLEWERAFGLPEKCITPPDTTTERQAALHEKVTRIGGQSPQYFIDLALRLGFVVTITEHGPRRHGDPYNSVYGDEEWVFVWDINAANTTIVGRRHGDLYGEPYQDWGNEVLECVIARLKPAHTLVRFIYS